MEDRDTALAGDLDVLVGAAGLAGQALHRIAVLQEAVRRSSAPAPRCGERAEHDAVRLRAELAALFESPLEPLDLAVDLAGAPGPDVGFEHERDPRPER